MIQRFRKKTYNFLRWGEKYTKTDNVYLAKGGFWLNGRQGLTFLSSFGLALLFARLIPKEVYGNYKYILSLAGLISTFSLTGISSAILQSVARGFPGTFILAVKILARWNSLVFAIAISVAIYYLANNNQTLGYGMVIVAFLFPAIRTFGVYESYTNGKRNFRQGAIYRGTVDIAAIFATAIGLFFTDSVLLLVAINLSTQFVLDAIFFKKIYQSITEEEKTMVEPGIIKFSKHLSLQNVLNNIASYVDKIFIFHFLGAAEVAIYTFATAIPQQVKGLASSLVFLITPKISQRNAKEAVGMIRGRFLLSLVILIPIIVLYVILAPVIFKILFPTYTDSVSLTRWYALIFLLIGNLSGLVLTTQKAVKEQYILTTFGSTSQIVLMLVLFYQFGIVGIIWGILISKYMTAILSYVLAKRFARERATETIYIK